LHIGLDEGEKDMTRNDLGILAGIIVQDWTG
jgi:hypothetical protein